MFSMMSVICYFFSIMLNTILLMSLNGVGRDSDQLKIYLRFDWVPTFTITLFALGYFFLVWGISCSLYLFAGTNICIAFTTLTTFIGGFVPIFLNNCIFIKVGHVIQHWYKSNPEDFKRKLIHKIHELQKEHMAKMVSNSDIENSKSN